MSELKPCPFCGGEATLIGDRIYVSHSKAGAGLFYVKRCPLLGNVFYDFDKDVWNTRTPESSELVIESEHPESICHDCKGPNVVWFTDSLHWNTIVRRTGIPDPMLCPRCFILRTRSQAAWQVIPADESSELVNDKEILDWLDKQGWAARNNYGNWEVQTRHTSGTSTPTLRQAALAAMGKEKNK